MDQPTAIRILRTAIVNMFRDDMSRKPKRSIVKTSERNISAWFRGFLQAAFAEGARYCSYQVDHEYNRVGVAGEPKRSPNLNKDYFVPDIVVHMRGVDSDHNPDANLLAIEVKRIEAFDGSYKMVEAWIEEDLTKLAELRNRNGMFRYRQVASLVFSRSDVWVSFDGSIQFEILAPVSAD